MRKQSSRSLRIETADSRRVIAFNYLCEEFPAMTGNSKKKNDGRPDDFPLDITCSVGEGGDQEAAAGLGSAPPPENNVRPGTGPKRGSTSHLATRPDAPSDRSADSESDGSGTARAGDINRRGSDRDSVRFHDEVNDVEDGAGSVGGGRVKDKFQKQYRNVRCLKTIVILLLIVTAVVVTWAVYHFTRTDEQGNFKLECECISTGLLDRSHGSLVFC